MFDSNFPYSTITFVTLDIQISVNIGGDPSGIAGDSLVNVNVQSPGMVSLNSMGTVSPVATPAPTPTPPTAVSTPLPLTLASTLSSKLAEATSSKFDSSQAQYKSKDLRY